MRLNASEFITYWRPNPCELRIFLKERAEPEGEPSAFDDVMRRLGIRHEKEHLTALGSHLDLSHVPIDERVERTIEAIAGRASVIYQPVFLVHHSIASTGVEIVGAPDFLILDGDGYVIRDSKMSRHIDPAIHPEIVVQVLLYGWLFERSTDLRAKDLQVYNGMKEVVSVAYDGGEWPLAVLENLLRIRLLKDEPYEPVGWTKCGGCSFNARCMDRTTAVGSVALVQGVDAGLAFRLHAMGIDSCHDLLANFDLATLSALERAYGRGERRVGKTAERILRFAQAMERQEERLLAAPVVPSSENYVMFDLEGLPAHMDEIETIYLWGTQVFGARPGLFMPAVAQFGANGDRLCWLAFLENARKVFDDYGDIPFVHWANYEETKLDLYVSRYGDHDGIAARVKNNLLDLLKVVRNAIVLPLPSFSLKVIEKYIGFARHLEEANGQWAMAAFIEATETDDGARREQLMNEIVKYNEEDLLAMWATFRWLMERPWPTDSASD